MNFNFIAIGIATLVPILIGFVWYHPKVFGTAWMNACGFTEESLKGANMPVIFGVSLIFSFILAFQMNFVSVHQTHVYSTMMDAENPKSLDDPTTELAIEYAAFMDKYGMNFRTYKHGAFHGVLVSIMFMLPILVINGLFERRGFKYIAINGGYWTVCLIIMSSLISGMV